jgi:hypothetical protein
MSREIPGSVNREQTPICIGLCPNAVAGLTPNHQSTQAALEMPNRRPRLAIRGGASLPVSTGDLSDSGQTGADQRDQERAARLRDLARQGREVWLGLTEPRLLRAASGVARTAHFPSARWDALKDCNCVRFGGDAEMVRGTVPTGSVSK